MVNRNPISEKQNYSRQLRRTRRSSVPVNKQIIQSEFRVEARPDIEGTAKSLEPDIQRIEKLSDDELRRRYQRAQRLAKAAELGLTLVGAGETGRYLAGAAGTTAGEMAEGETMGRGLRKAGANVAGYITARKLAKKKGYSEFKSGAIGGAIAEALKGGSKFDIAKTAWSWAVLRAAFKGLWTLVGFIPSFIYLHVHLFLNKVGLKKVFGDFLLIQKIQFIFVNVIVFIILLVSFVLFAIIIDIYQNPSRYSGVIKELL